MNSRNGYAHGSQRRPRSEAGIADPPLSIETFGWKSVADVEPQALGLTYRFQAAEDGDPYSVTIRFTGRRIGVKGKPTRRDSFSALESIDQILPGSGRVTITTRVSDIAPGEWHVTATPINDRQRGRDPRATSTQRPSLPSASASGPTGFAPVIRIRAPGARLGAWPTLVALGVAVALTTLSLLASRFHLNVVRVMLVSLIACLVGLVCAKVYYWMGHRGEPGSFIPGGSCIQGFLLGAVGALIVGARVADLPGGRVLDLATPGLLFGMVIGRFGCFFGGCCVGRLTASRWGLWSSDRRLGVRRVPVQLLESALALTLGLTTLLTLLTVTPRRDGVVIVGAIAAYTFGRQLLFPLRDNPHTPRGRAITMALMGLVIFAAIATAIVR